MNNPLTHIAPDIQEVFYKEIIDGMRLFPKRLPSKYFYDEQGDKLFQKIMDCPEYYLTRSELSIFMDHTESLAGPILSLNQPFDIIELGAGDGTKTVHLLRYLMNEKLDFQYLPIDISGNILSELETKLTSELPNLPVETFEGEYFTALESVTSFSSRPKLVLFLGSNIGNMAPDEALLFCNKLRACLNAGDMALIGFDLRKNPQTILNAYNDKGGFTRDFNLNLLERMNRELHADFNLDQFTHYQMYDPETGSCRSYLVSLCNQNVTIGDHNFTFADGEYIHTETSQKYTFDDIQTMAESSNFQSVAEFTDEKKWFADVYWKAI